MPDNIFEQVRNAVTIAQAIDFLRLGEPAERAGQQLRFKCPACKDKDGRALAIHLDKGFTCYATSEKKRGDDATSLVAHCRGIRNGQAAQELRDAFISAARGPSATKPEAKAEGKGRSSAAPDAFAPLELLGVAQDLADRLHIQIADGRVLFEQRDEHGVKLGTLALATRDDLPLVEWITEAEVPAQAEGLKGLWRIVKGRA